MIFLSRKPSICAADTAARTLLVCSLSVHGLCLSKENVSPEILPASMKASVSMTRVGGLVPAGSRLCFEDHIERRLGGASDIAEAAGRDDLAQLGLAGLCAESRTHFL